MLLLQVQTLGTLLLCVLIIACAVAAGADAGYATAVCVLMSAVAAGADAGYATDVCVDNSMPCCSCI